MTQTLLWSEIFNYLSIVSLRWKKFSLQGDHQYQISRKFIFPPVFRWKSQVSQWPFLQSHMDDRLHRGWGREQKGWQNGKKDKQKKTQKKKRERERYTHTHIHTHSRSYNDDYNDNIITTIIIFIPSSSPFSLTLFLSLLLSFISNFLRTHSHEKICKKKFHHSSLSLPLLLFFFSSFRSSGAQL